jgi:hypothetical protein
VAILEENRSTPNRAAVRADAPHPSRPAVSEWYIRPLNGPLALDQADFNDSEKLLMPAREDARGEAMFG